MLFLIFTLMKIAFLLCGEV